MSIWEHFEKTNRERHLSRLKKRLIRAFAGHVESRPIFVFGLQRSGTTMLMHVFHLHPDTQVFDEHKSNKVYENFQVRSLEVVEETIRRSKAPFICFKPLADSHKFHDFYKRFPNGRFIWLYRDYRDAANSALRMFEHSTRAIQLICTNQPGGGWFQAGTSEETAKVLRSVYTPEMSQFDLACLGWWARNRLFFEQKLVGLNHVRLIRYENLVSDPKQGFKDLFAFLGFPYNEASFKEVNPGSIRKNAYPELHPAVTKLCESLLLELDQLAEQQLDKDALKPVMNMQTSLAEAASPAVKM